MKAIHSLLLCLTVSVAAQAASFTLEQVLSSPFPSGLVAASNAPRIAWVFHSKGTRNVWVADGPTFAARQVTHYSGDDGTPIASLRITPDGRTVVYVRGTETNPDFDNWSAFPQISRIGRPLSTSFINTSTA